MLETPILPRTNRQNGAATSSPRSVYQERCQRFAARRDELQRRWNRMANLRLGLFAAALVLLGLGIWRGIALLFIAAALCFAGFVFSVAQHRRLGSLRRRYAELWDINDEGLRRLRRDWETLPLRRPPNPPADHPYAGDLDLLGHASLQHLLGTVYTPVGQRTLEDWLLTPAPPAVIAERQVAVGELAPKINFRDELALRGRLLGSHHGGTTPFLDWAEGDVWLLKRPWLVWLARLLPIALLGSFVAYLAGWTPYPLWLVLLIVNISLVLTLGRRADETIEGVATRQGVFRTYADLFGLLGSQPWTALELRRVQSELTAGDLRADQQMARFGRIMALGDLRMWMFYFPFNVLTLWSFHVLFLLESWQQVAGGHTRAWLQALGDAEALSALATLKHDEPGWCFPRLRRAPVLTADALGHPLLSDAMRVANDVEVGPPSTFVLVTGSNMSGKSTLLRAVGVNVVLAQVGGPVCASSFHLPSITLATSMRVQDSLEQGVSYFMAELMRLKQVVEQARTVHHDGQRVLLFLLDEILHGTNTLERQIAARRIIRHLLDLDAIGMVSTHDLQLAEGPEIRDAYQPVHFTENFMRGADGPHMQFDYLLRPGLAQSTNALKLMEIVGLDLKPHESGELATSAGRQSR